MSRPSSKRKSVLAAFVLAGLLGGCGDGDSGPVVTPQSSEDERGSVGVPNPATDYCTRAGFTVESGQCKFPDGTSCEQWSFYRASCGQAHSYCSQHGGTVSSKTEDMGGWTAVYAACDLNGKQCREDTFVHTGKCD